MNIQPFKENFEYIYSLIVDLTDKNKFNSLIKRNFKKKSYRFEMLMEEFNTAVEHLNDETEYKKYQLVEINDNVKFLFDLNDVDTQFILPRSEYFELMRRVQTIHPFTATELKKIKNIFKCIPTTLLDEYLENYGLPGIKTKKSDGESPNC